MKSNKYSFFWEQEGKLRDSGKRTADEFLEEFRNREVKPLFRFPANSVEFNMDRCHFNEAISIADPKDREQLIEKYNKCAEMTSYTNYTGGD